MNPLTPRIALFLLDRYDLVLDDIDAIVHSVFEFRGVPLHDDVVSRDEHSYLHILVVMNDPAVICPYWETPNALNLSQLSWLE